MNTTIKKVTLSEKDTLANLLEKYNYEFSQYDKRQFNSNGLFGYKYLNKYFTEESRYAYFIYVDEILAGFALIFLLLAIFFGSESIKKWNRRGKGCLKGIVKELQFR